MMVEKTCRNCKAEMKDTSVEPCLNCREITTPSNWVSK